MSERIYLNDKWHFTEKFTDELLKPGYDAGELEEVRLPHTVKETPFNYFDEHIYQMVSGYVKKFDAPKEWNGKCILLTIDGAAHKCEVYLNGKKAGEHNNGYTAFTIDISEYLEFGRENTIAIKLDSNESLNIPPFGFVIDYMTYGGLYREVWIDVKEKNYISDVFVYSEVDVTDKAIDVSKPHRAKLISETEINEYTEGLVIRQSIRKCGTEKFEEISESAANEKKIRIENELIDIMLWDTESPILYEVKTELIKNGNVTDEKIIKMGFRKAEFKADGFYLNGRKIKLRGLNRHQSFPYVGYAMPESMQRLDADILKNELGVNAVRTSHYPQSHYFLDECDRLGLLVFTEMPGWQHIGDSEWKSQAVENVREMILQYRNHASIILWGVRINESSDDDEFYQRTNFVAHETDPTRPTGGVRVHKKSSLLEDVYTYNDFLHNGRTAGCDKKSAVTSDMKKPYLISEYNGHMYPTKSFDCEEKRAEHALRHVRVLDAVAGYEDIAGCFGWCMFDYNTHKDFGSGDRICYHGVTDMFRNPKAAAYVYATQQDETPVLYVDSSMDIGERPGGIRGNIYLYTNADSVRMYRNDKFIKEYKSTDSAFKNLKHGPILIDDFIGNSIAEGENFSPGLVKSLNKGLNAIARYGMADIPKRYYLTVFKVLVLHRMKYRDVADIYNKYVGDWGGTSTKYRFDAIKDGKVVSTVTREPMHEIHLDVKTDRQKLKEKTTYDVALLRITARDENNNLLSFFGEPVNIRTEGPIKIIGPETFSLKGGMGGTYIKTTGVSGKAAVYITSAQTKTVKTEFEII